MFMPRLVVALVLANAGFFAWTLGWLAPLGLAPDTQAEPFRLAQQIRPEAMQLLPPSADSNSLRNTPSGANPPSTNAALPPATSAPAGLPASAAPEASTALNAPQSSQPTECLQAGLFTELQAQALRPLLQTSLPPGSWSLEPRVEPGRWIIYMGPYTSEEQLNKKRSELRQRGVKFETVQNPALNPGLSLGNFNTKQAADVELAKDATLGVRTARVLQERPEERGQLLQLPTIDAALKQQVEALKPRLSGKSLQSCR